MVNSKANMAAVRADMERKNKEKAEEVSLPRSRFPFSLRECGPGFVFVFQLLKHQEQLKKRAAEEKAEEMQKRKDLIKQVCANCSPWHHGMVLSAFVSAADPSDGEACCRARPQTA